MKENIMSEPTQTATATIETTYNDELTNLRSEVDRFLNNIDNLESWYDGDRPSDPCVGVDCEGGAKTRLTSCRSSLQGANERLELQINKLR